MKKGLNIPIKGEADLRVSKTISPDVIAVKPSDFKGLIPRLLVKEGDRVLAGSPVLSDKKNPDILIASPASGTVCGIVRGEKRKLLAVLIKADDKQEYFDFGVQNPDSMSAEEIKGALLKSGLWPWLIQRPYGIIANPDVMPKAIFVSAFNTAPLAPNPEFALGNELACIQRGINALAKLTGGGVHVSLCDGNYASTPFHKIENAVLHKFEGKHPAGNVGVQISHICPIRKDATVWTVSLLGLAMIGRMFSTGHYVARRKIAVTGPMAVEPAYAEALPGTPIKAFAGFYGSIADQIRFISGDVLTGENVGEDGFTGFYSDQITLVREGSERELFGWIRPIRYKQFSTDHCYFSWLTPWRKYDMDTNLHGGARAFLMNDAYYAKVLPMDIYPLYLVKACLAGDIDKMEKFGIYEVLPEDLALCEFVDPSKNDIQDIIAKGIDLMLKEMA
ncbi:MAG: Na(+)-translocating NADH-quinone reductase subunit A [Bacteroidales bacterium]|nr:Na(+)-translocating NADH-quinone reductase subunit A [Bacteroidales bacterium]